MGPFPGESAHHISTGFPNCRKIFLLLFFWDRISLWTPGWSWTDYVSLAGLKLVVLHLCLLSIGIIGKRHHAQLIFFFLFWPKSTWLDLKMCVVKYWLKIEIDFPKFTDYDSIYTAFLRSSICVKIFIFKLWILSVHGLCIICNWEC